MDTFGANLIKSAKTGQIIPIHKKTKALKCPIEFFAKLSDYGRNPHCLLLESASTSAKYAQFSMGTASPCLKISGNKKNFKILSLNPTGDRFLEFIKDDLSFCDTVKYEKNQITGTLKPNRRRLQTEQERLKQKTHVDILRAIAFKFKPTAKPMIPYAGLFGTISYDFIDQFENLPKNRHDILKTPDYEMYFADNLFICDHKKGITYFIANALITGKNTGEILKECKNTIDKYTQTQNQEKIPRQRTYKKKKVKLTTDTSKQEFIDTVNKMKHHIKKGDIFQAVPSRTIMTEYNAEPLDIYRTLRRLNPSPYMFFINSGTSILLGASPEMSLRVVGEKQKKVEIRPIAGTRPRGIINGKIDADLDSKYEIELKLDKKEVAEHVMLVDLARNDIARVSKPGTRVVDEPFVAEKYSHVQHLVSNVSGTLKDDLDALHAYLASMNMGTLTGAPKIRAMELIRLNEKNKRCLYGGAVAYLTPSKDFDSTIIIRSIHIKDSIAHIRSGAGIVYDSVPEKEYEETIKKAKACLSAIELTGGVEYENPLD
ncbi:MAG: anthranilate synthase component 1 [archaeon]|nr:anthranilate synthase component 1 [archaeon]